VSVHGAMSWGWASARGRVLADAGLGVLGYVVPPEVVDGGVGDGLAWEMRLRSLPARVGVYFVLGLCLFTDRPYGQVIGQVTAGLRERLAAVGWRVPSSTALTGVRRRLGERPLESVFRRLCSPLSPGRAPWSHIGGLLAVAWDGTTIGVADTAENAAAFGRPGAGGTKNNKKKKKEEEEEEEEAGEGAVPGPQARLVMLLACGTRGVIDAAMGPCRGKGTGERALAAGLLGSLRAGMLLLADRNFYSWDLWNAAAGTGADLLWRVQEGVPLPAAAELEDGSYLARIPDPAAVRRRTARNGARRRRGSKLPPDTGPVRSVTVRVIEYVLTVTAEEEGADGQPGAVTLPEPYRLITTVLDWRRYPAAELAAAYSWRWAIETGYRECKTYLRGSGRLLRGQTPDLARQELWALLAIYQAVRTLIVRAAAAAGLDPDRISFTGALDAIRGTMASPRSQLTATVAETEARILTGLVPARTGRICPRARKRRPCPYPSPDRTRTPLPRHATYTATITPPGTTHTNTPHQHKHPATTPSQPP
jgi:hypothetical protein